MLLVLYTAIRYPGSPATPEHLKYAVIATVALLVAAAIILLLGRFRSPQDLADISFGNRVGAVTGILWVLEISFNNFINPAISTGHARFIVDNTAWGIIALIILIASIRQSVQTRNSASALRVGASSGIVSGLFACLMGLSLIVFGMRFLLRDPLNIQEFASRGSASQSKDMATYFAYETMTGALGHLLAIGLLMGLLLGLLGGAIAKLVLWTKPGARR
jgi:hypothetical protein